MLLRGIWKRPSLGSLLLSACLTLLGASGSSLQAHELAFGVGTQTEFFFFPDKIQLKVNFGVSPQEGFVHLSKADSNQDLEVSEAEAQAFIREMGPALLPLLDARINGQRLELQLGESSEVGMMGEVGQFTFDCYFNYEAPLPSQLPDVGGWWLHYHDQTFPDQVATQFCWVHDQGHGPGMNYSIFDPVPMPEMDSFQTVGRTLTMFFAQGLNPRLYDRETPVPTAEELARLQPEQAPAPTNQGTTASSTHESSGLPLPDRDLPQQEKQTERANSTPRSAVGPALTRWIVLLFVAALGFIAGALQRLGARADDARSRLTGSALAVVALAAAAYFGVSSLRGSWVTQEHTDRLATLHLTPIALILLLGFATTLLRSRPRSHSTAKLPPTPESLTVIFVSAQATSWIDALGAALAFVLAGWISWRGPGERSGAGEHDEAGEGARAAVTRWGLLGGLTGTALGSLLLWTLAQQDPSFLRNALAGLRSAFVGS